MNTGILTMHRVRNCGSFLQTFALSEALAKRNYKVEVIDYIYPNDNVELSIFDKPVTLSNALKHLLPNICHRRWRLLSVQWQMIKWVYMLHRKLKLSQHTYYSSEELILNPPRYDYYLLGSDQVWNERFTKCDPIFFLTFAPQGTACLSFASSAPNTNFSDLFLSCFSKYLKEFKCVSTREKVSACYLSNYLSQRVESLLDPIFLLSKNEWNQVLRINDNQRRYVLFFVLNYMGDVYSEAINRLEEILINHEELEIYSNTNILSHSSLAHIKGRKIKVLDDILPKQFVQIIANAKYIITDSFHATAFGFLYEKKVIPVVSDIMNDVRIVDMCERIGTQDENAFFCLDKQRLVIEKEKSNTFFNNIFDAENG